MRIDVFCVSGSRTKTIGKIRDHAYFRRVDDTSISMYVSERLPR